MSQILENIIKAKEEKIEKLTKQLEVAREALKFYADKKSWEERWVDTMDDDSSGYVADVISFNDVEIDNETNEIWHGGKLARQALSKLDAIERGEG